MFKKAILSIALVGFIGILVVGAVLRTRDKTDRQSESGEQGRGRSAQNALVDENQRQTAGQQRGQSSRDRTEDIGDGLAIGEAAVEEWATREGVVIASNEEMLTILLDDGESLVIEGRAWSFAQEQNLAVDINDRLVLHGFFEGDTFEVGHIDNLTTQQAVALREESGRPLWAGRGRRTA